MNNVNYISLSELNGLIREAIEINFIDEIWLVAEIAEIRLAGAGHCYLDLVEKREGKIVARMRANIWKFQYERISANFFSSTGTNLQKGMKVLFSVSLSFHEQYGVSLVVKNIDSNYSIGDLERKKKEIIQKLIQEKLIGKNAELELELVPKRIAIISSETAAGYGDFKSQLERNSAGYVFQTTLFQSIMQGTGLEASVVTNLHKITSRYFDCIVLIRGGGASLDLAGFDNYELAKAIANSELPVLTGIGHERDDTIADMVANTKLKTPTAVAEFLIGRMQEFEDYYNGLREALVFFTRQKVTLNKVRLNQLSHETKSNTQKILGKNRVNLARIKSTIPRVAKAYYALENQKSKQFVSRLSLLKSTILNEQKTHLSKVESTIRSGCFRIIEKQNSKIILLRKSIKLIHPDNVLKRGYAMILKNGKVLTEKGQLEKGSEIEIKLRDGIKKSKIIE
jgi:exodeoxyribonuclease VII large subunit